MHIFNMSATYLQSVEKIQYKRLEELFHNVYTINHQLLGAVMEKWLSKKPCKFVKKYFFCIKLLHAHLHYVCNIAEKIQWML